MWFNPRKTTTTSSDFEIQEEQEAKKKDIVLELLQEKSYLTNDLIKIKSHSNKGRIRFNYYNEEFVQPISVYSGSLHISSWGTNVDYSSVVKELERVVIKRLSEIEEELRKYDK